MNIFFTYINENQRTSLLSSLRAFLRSFIRRWTLDVGCWAFALGVRPKPTAYSRQSAFTLIEVLVAMAVLSILILLAANVFQGSSSAFNIGTQKADMNTAARAAMDFMVRELESAVVGPVEAANPPALPVSLQVNNGNDVLFRSLVGDLDGGGRALRNASFYILGNQLMYAHQLADPYTTLPSHAGAGMLITNILDFRLYVYTNESDLADGTPAPDTETHYQFPLCVDIVLEMLSDDDMQKYIATGEDADFRGRNAKVYTTRVYFPNRMGYR